MTQRRVQLLGFTAGAAITVNWNGEQVFSGTLPAQGDTDNLCVLAEWQCDTDVVGPTPLAISVAVGSMTFATVMMNHVSPGYVAPLLSDAAQWTVYEPTAAELQSDLADMGSQELLDKYAIEPATLQSWLIPQDPIPTENNLREPFEITEDNDGKLDLKINDVPHFRHSVREYWGAWQWGLMAGQVLTCDILIDPNIVQG